MHSRQDGHSRRYAHDNDFWGYICCYTEVADDNIQYLHTGDFVDVWSLTVYFSVVSSSLTTQCCRSDIILSFVSGLCVGDLICHDINCSTIPVRWQNAVNHLLIFQHYKDHSVNIAWQSSLAPSILLSLQLPLHSSVSKLTYNHS